MVERDWIVLDMNFLMWREFFSAGARDPVRSAFGVLSSLATYSNRFQSPHLVFAFDRGPYLRSGILSGYKAKRRNIDPENEEDVAKEELRRMIDRVRTDMLPALGYGNILSQQGFEADDMMAAAIAAAPPDDRVIMVARDRDLFQLLSARAAYYNPVDDQFYTARQFRKDYGIAPADWVTVKAVAGCDSDEVPGLDGVAETSVLQFLRLRGGTGKRPDAIRAYLRGEEYRRNLRLVKLPYDGVRPVTLVPDEPTDPRAFWRLCERYGVPAAVPNGSRYAED